MLLCDFQAKLRRLHPGLYVKTDARKELAEGFHITGIYIKVPKREVYKYTTRVNKNAVNHKHEDYLNAAERGELDKFICGVCLEQVPEYDIFCLVNNSMLAPGWRKIALRMVKLKICSLAHARKIFSCSSLGESDYDKMSFFKRLNWAKDINNKRPQVIGEDHA